RMYHPQSGCYYVGNYIEDLRVCLMDGDLNQRRDDAWFIALARTDIPALLQHIEVLRRLRRTAQHSLVALYGFVATDRPDLVHMPDDLSMKINNGVEVMAINRVLGDSYPETFTQDELLALGKEIPNEY